MNNKKVDKKLNKIGKIILIIGAILTVLGIVLGIVGIVLFGTAFDISNIDEVFEFNKLFSGVTLFTISPIITEVGIVTSVAGGIIILVSYLGEIISFADTKVVPAVQNGVDSVTPTAKKVVHSVSTGFNTACNEFKKKD